MLKPTEPPPPKHILNEQATHLPLKPVSINRTNNYYRI
uniref:Uncharacterized protein n=1 Tax=Anguilla anguilla TaxID=7936 RepID=A0A0E9R8U6_ANGAN